MQGRWRERWRNDRRMVGVQREGRGRGGTTVGRMEEEQHVMRCFILIQGSVRGGRYLLIILLYYLTLKRENVFLFVSLQCQIRAAVDLKSTSHLLLPLLPFLVFVFVFASRLFLTSCLPLSSPDTAPTSSSRFSLFFTSSLIPSSPLYAYPSLSSPPLPQHTKRISSRFKLKKKKHSKRCLNSGMLRNQSLTMHRTHRERAGERMQRQTGVQRIKCINASHYLYSQACDCAAVREDVHLRPMVSYTATNTLIQ